MDETTAAPVESTAAPDAAPVAPVEASIAVPAVPVAPEPAAPRSTLLSDAAADPWGSVPAKYQVKKDDGSLDQAATLSKLNQGYSEATRMASRTEPRPRTAEEYTVPETAKTFFERSDPNVAEFMKGAHAVALSQRQMDFVAGQLAKVAPRLVEGARALDAKSAESQLREHYGDKFDEAIAAADRAVHQLAPDDIEVLRAVQNRPPLIRLLAKIGEQLDEDTPPQDVAPTGGEDINQLLAHPAYSDPKHAEHEAISARARAYFARQPGAKLPAS